MWVGFAVFWILCGGVAAYIANARGADGGLGFLAGVLLGPFGIVIAAFMGSDSARDERAISVGSKKKCPRCAEPVQREALVCRFCGHEFSEDMTPPPPLPVYIPYDHPRATTADDKQKDSDALWIIGTIAVIIVAVLIVFLAFGPADKSTELAATSNETQEVLDSQNLQAEADRLDRMADETAVNLSGEALDP